MERARLVETVRAAEAFATSALAALQDFHVFTGHSYQQYAEMVKAGHIRGSIHNARTGTAVEAVEMASILRGYFDTDLSRVVLYQAVAHFEFFYFGFLAMLLRFNPRALSTDRQVAVNGQTVFSERYARAREIRGRTRTQSPAATGSPRISAC